MGAAKDPINVWVFRPDGHHDMVLRTDLNYFKTHFVGESMKATWVPPQFEIIGKSKKLRDFVSWMLQAPVISERAKIALEPLVGRYAEILPLTQLRNRMFYGVNVTKFIDCLDLEKSDVVYSADESRVMHVWSYVFHQSKLEDVPIFRLPHGGHIFVTQSFVDAVQKSGLQGAKFTDPAASQLFQICRS